MTNPELQTLDVFVAMVFLHLCLLMFYDYSRELSCLQL